jgi:hypothetical protein
VVLELLAQIPGQSSMSLEQLRDAVPGLAGITGFLLFPTIGGWIRVLVELIEWDRPGLNRPRRVSGTRTLRAVGVTALLAFFMLTTLRAAGELRGVQTEAPVVSTGLQGMVVGIAFWAIYAVGLSTLRRDSRRRDNERRMGGLLR